MTNDAAAQHVQEEALAPRRHAGGRTCLVGLVGELAGLDTLMHEAGTFGRDVAGAASAAHDVAADTIVRVRRRIRGKTRSTLDTANQGGSERREARGGEPHAQSRRQVKSQKFPSSSCSSLSSTVLQAAGTSSMALASGELSGTTPSASAASDYGQSGCPAGAVSDGEMNTEKSTFSRSAGQGAAGQAAEASSALSAAGRPPS